MRHAAHECSKPSVSTARGIHVACLHGAARAFRNKAHACAAIAHVTRSAVCIRVALLAAGLDIAMLASEPCKAQACPAARAPANKQSSQKQTTA
jgi:hypothetical protein